MSPASSLGMLLHHSDVLARRMNDGEINDSAVAGLLSAVADHWCDPVCRAEQLGQATRNYEKQVG